MRRKRVRQTDVLPRPRVGQRHLDRARLDPLPFAQQVSRYHWPRRTATQPVCAIIAWREGTVAAELGALELCAVIAVAADVGGELLPHRAGAGSGPVERVLAVRRSSSSNEPFETRLMASAAQTDARRNGRTAAR